MIVIGIIGPKGAGKDTIARHIAETHNGKAHSHSEILDDILKIVHIENTRENEIKLVSLRKVFRPDTLIKALNKRISEAGTGLVAVTGIRFDNEFQNIRSFPKNAMIYVNAPIEKRFEWQLKRKQKANDQKMDFEQFKALEQKETEIHINELGEKADYKIENSGDEQELFNKVDQIVAKIFEQYGIKEAKTE